MHGFRYRTLCIFVGLMLVLTSCKKENGTANQGGPVFNAQDGNEQGENKLSSDLVERLKQVKSSGGRDRSFLRPSFVDKAMSLGVRFELFRDAIVDRYYFPEVMGGGIAWIDFDLDGYTDLYLANGDTLVGSSSHLNQVYRNDAGERFDNVTPLVSANGNGFFPGSFNWRFESGWVRRHFCLKFWTELFVA